MTDHRGDVLLDRVRTADPAPFDTVRGWSRSTEGRAVADRVVRDAGGAGVRTARRRVRGRLLVAAALLLLLGVASFVQAQKSNDALAVGCYAEARLDTDIAVIQLGDASSPVAACARAWPSLFGKPAPAQLVGCRLPGGGHAVFPVPEGQDPSTFCATLGASTDQ
jgi:hypothetical protein